MFCFYLHQLPIAFAKSYAQIDIYPKNTLYLSDTPKKQPK